MDIVVTETKLQPWSGDVIVTDIKLMQHNRRMQRGYWKRKPRVSVSFEGETILENLENRRSCPIKLLRRVCEETLDSLGVKKSMVEFRWSQKAGCNCGCSPGFIVEGYDPIIDGKDVFVTIQGLN